MVRKHGWQLPAHTFQVVAITVFCLLVVAFYAFFAPFLGDPVWEYVLIGTHSPVALLVFILYVRCTAINPADSGIMSRFYNGGTNNLNANHGLSVKDLPRRFDGSATGASSPSSVSRSSIAGANSSNKGSLGEVGGGNYPAEPTARSVGGVGILCALFVHQDCRKQQEGAVDDQGGEGGDEALFCTLCNSEDEVVPHLEPGMVPSTIDPDAAGATEREHKAPKRPVRISVWKLAKLDSNEAMRAAAKARASSSVLRPLDKPDHDRSSSGNMSEE